VLSQVSSYLSLFSVLMARSACVARMQLQGNDASSLAVAYAWKPAASCEALLHHHVDLHAHVSSRCPEVQLTIAILLEFPRLGEFGLRIFDGLGLFRSR
jgi:hypothetical protein